MFTAVTPIRPTVRLRPNHSANIKGAQEISSSAKDGLIRAAGRIGRYYCCAGA
jgi:hypothetical protein